MELKNNLIYFLRGAKYRLPSVFLGLVVLLLVASTCLLVADRVDGGVDIARVAELMEPGPGRDSDDTRSGGSFPPVKRSAEEEPGGAGEPPQAGQPAADTAPEAAAAQPQIQASPPLQVIASRANALSAGSEVPGPEAVFVFKGYGRAHGVGLCMDGVKYRALAGHSYMDIINYYYTGVTLTQVDESQPIRVKGRDGQVRTLPMKEYLYRLVEEPEDYPAEGLKVLYVAARTYTLSCMARGKHAQGGYDICSSGSCCQAFSENKDLSKYPNNIAAVNATAGQALFYDGSPITAAYCGSCGGHTDNNEDVWGGQPMPYLRGRPDPYCASSPRFTSVTELSVSQLESRLASAGLGVGSLRLVDLSNRTPGGRVKVARFTGSSGTREMSGLAFAKLLGFTGSRYEYSFR